MRILRIVHAGAFVLAMALPSLVLLSGCGDETKTTGTQVQVTEQQKKEMDEMNAAIKAERAAGKK